MADDLKARQRSELDRLAADAGVPNPDALPNKDAVVEAITTPNPALAPEPEARGVKRYRVAGPHAVFGHAPNDVFDREIPEDQERLLLDSGALKESRAQEPDAVDPQPQRDKE